MCADSESDFHSPFILKKCLDWKIVSWTLDDWKLCFSQNKNEYSIRKGFKKCSIEPHWERNCETVYKTVGDFLDILASSEDRELDSWFYLDYKHIAECFMDVADRMDVTWKLFGYPERTAKDSTLWMGTPGAHTPCHFDSYGYNLVSQIYGRKRWILINPKETHSMKPTRIPYEESSIYSNINFFCGCADFSGLEEVRVVELEPGDVLYVPRHWWHYVENITSAISLNTWIPLKSDDGSRLEESLVKILISSFCKDIKSSEINDILNPNEDDLTCIDNARLFEELNWCLKNSSNVPSINCNLALSDKNRVCPITSEELSAKLKEKCTSETSRAEGRPLNNISISRNDIINAFCHPDVIDLVRKKIQETYISRSFYK